MSAPCVARSKVVVAEHSNWLVSAPLEELMWDIKAVTRWQWLQARGSASWPDDCARDSLGESLDDGDAHGRRFPC